MKVQILEIRRCQRLTLVKSPDDGSLKAQAPFLTALLPEIPQGGGRLIREDFPAVDAESF